MSASSSDALNASPNHSSELFVLGGDVNRRIGHEPAISSPELSLLDKSPQESAIFCHCGFCPNWWLLNPPITLPRTSSPVRANQRGASISRQPPDSTFGRTYSPRPNKCPSHDFSYIPTPHRYYVFGDGTSALSSVQGSDVGSHFQVFRPDGLRVSHQIAGSNKQGAATQGELFTICMELWEAAQDPAWVTSPSESLKLLHIGTDCGRFVKNFRGITQGNPKPIHLFHTLTKIIHLVSILEAKNWTVHFIYYPRHHPLLREADAICRYGVYRHSEVPRYPQELWKNFSLDLKTFVKNRLDGNDEPPWPIPD